MPVLFEAAVYKLISRPGSRGLQANLLPMRYRDHATAPEILSFTIEAARKILRASTPERPDTRHVGKCCMEKDSNDRQHNSEQNTLVEDNIMVELMLHESVSHSLLILLDR